jgi:hypothetical protein
MLSVLVHPFSNPCCINRQGAALQGRRMMQGNQAAQALLQRRARCFL